MTGGLAGIIAAVGREPEHRAGPGAPMPIIIPAEARCDHCGATAPCKLDCSFSWKSMHRAGRTYEEPGVAIRGLPSWFWRDVGVACSESFKEALSSQPRFADYQGTWRECN